MVQQVSSDLSELTHWSELPSGQGGNKRLADLAATLVSQRYVQSKHKDIRLLVACSIADLLRVTAPEAPYSQEQLVVTPSSHMAFFLDMTRPPAKDAKRIFSPHRAMLPFAVGVFALHRANGRARPAALADLLEALPPAGAARLGARVHDSPHSARERCDRIDAKPVRTIFSHHGVRPPSRPTDGPTARTRARTCARTHARTHMRARTHARAHKHTTPHDVVALGFSICGHSQ